MTDKHSRKSEIETLANILTDVDVALAATPLTYTFDGVIHPPHAIRMLKRAELLLERGVRAPLPTTPDPFTQN